MSTPPTLALDAGFFSSIGSREENEDFGGFVQPPPRDLEVKGWIGAIADGVTGSGERRGREAAERTVRGLFNDYYATPDTWDVHASLDKVISALNRWLHDESRRAGAAGSTTLTTLVLRGAYYYFAHVGDSRLYRLRDGRLEQLTTDHVWDRPEMSHVLTRAVGLDTRVIVDQGSGALQAHDVFLLASDGVHRGLKRYDIEYELKRLLAEGPDRPTAEVIATTLCEQAVRSADDNASAVVVHVRALAALAVSDALRLHRDLRVPRPLVVGQSIDGLVVDAVLTNSRQSVVYRVHEAVTGAARVMKTLHFDADDDVLARTALAHEEWLARRVTAKFFAQVVEPPQPASALYFLLEWHDGKTLAQRLAGGERVTVPEVIRIGQQVLRAAGALHRRGIVHRDIKPENLHEGQDGVLRLLDLGVALSGLDLPLLRDAVRAGTPSYLAPELFGDDAAASPQTDLYAVGVTLYYLLARHYPYGEIEPFQRPSFGTAAPVTRWRPDVPRWLEVWLAKGVAVDPKQRFETAEEMLLALEQGPLAASNIAPPARQPLAQRYPRGLLVVLLLASLALNVALLWRLFGT
ncbi:MAG TPA: protein phosphatase 2C domain-containing protein [Burkholderiaceae bacterium]|nr:protein phosphatase 2C domain-containing protein [Burkholderiaceae bacterium]